MVLLCGLLASCLLSTNRCFLKCKACYQHWAQAVCKLPAPLLASSGLSDYACTGMSPPLVPWRAVVSTVQCASLCAMSIDAVLLAVCCLAFAVLASDGPHFYFEHGCTHQRSGEVDALSSTRVGNCKLDWTHPASDTAHRNHVKTVPSLADK